MKKYLIIETFPFTPHIEAAAEIAINLKKKIRFIFFGVGMICRGRIGNYHGIRKCFFFPTKKKL